jgi:diguanylate cyclase (GGDEF)-like protein
VSALYPQQAKLRIAVEVKIMDESFQSENINSIAPQEINTTRVSNGRFDENLISVIKEIMAETLTNLDWWGGQVWWFLPDGLEQSAWQLQSNSPASLNHISAPSLNADLVPLPKDLHPEPILVSVDDLTWMPNQAELKAAGVRHVVIIDVVAADRPSVRLAFIVPSANALTLEARHFLAVSGMILPKMVVRERVRIELQFRATHDPLTGLLNRRGLSQLVENSPVASRNLRAVIFIDINKFKQVNDQHGHETGDELLVHIGKKLAEQVRPTDSLARIGGDEFVILASEITDAAAAEIFATRLWNSISAKHTLSNDVVWHGSASIGVSLWQPGENYNDALRTADMLMYRAKKSGGGIEVETADQLFTPNLAGETNALILNMVRPTKLSSSPDSEPEAAAAVVNIGSILRSPDPIELAESISTCLAGVEKLPEQVWLRLPKSFWLDGDRITTLLDALERQNLQPKISLVISCEQVSYESRTIAQEILMQFSIGCVLESFGSGNRDFELLAMLNPIALTIDPLTMHPHEPEFVGSTTKDWVAPRAVIAVAASLGIDSVAPFESNEVQIRGLAKLGCTLQYETSTKRSNGTKGNVSSVKNK